VAIQIFLRIDPLKYGQTVGPKTSCTTTCPSLIKETRSPDGQMVCTFFGFSPEVWNYTIQSGPKITSLEGCDTQSQTTGNGQPCIPIPLFPALPLGDYQADQPYLPLLSIRRHLVEPLRHYYRHSSATRPRSPSPIPSTLSSTLLRWTDDLANDLTLRLP